MVASFKSCFSVLVIVIGANNYFPVLLTLSSSLNRSFNVNRIIHAIEYELTYGQVLYQVIHKILLSCSCE